VAKGTGIFADCRSHNGDLVFGNMVDFEDKGVASSFVFILDRI
jgi:hypothetical protein